MLLVDASGQYSWLMATSGHCVLDARLSSVTACWLMAIWMNVAHAVAAHWPHGQYSTVMGARRRVTASGHRVRAVVMHA